MLRLTNVIRDYAWGSATDLPRFLGTEPDGTPAAELWIGTHPLGPSVVEGGTGLRDVVGGDLPYMMKVLAVAEPLSIQVHPREQIAEAGFAAEEDAGVPLGAANRSYPDPLAKREMVYALTDFDTLLGLRPAADTAAVLEALDVPFCAALAASLRANPTFEGVVAAIESILAAESSVVDAVVERSAALVGDDPLRAHATVVEVADKYPGDPGVLITLLLNRVTLRPGEAAFLDAGTIHAHLKGMCVEVMASSDNVLRAGLTPKHIDRAGLVAALDGDLGDTGALEPQGHGGAVRFEPRPGDFALAVSSGGSDLPGGGQRLVLCIEGEVEIAGTSGSIALTRGESAYVDEADGDLTVTGSGTVAQAYVA